MMSESVTVIYNDGQIQLDHLDARLRASAQPTWSIRMTGPHLVELPDTPSAAEFKRMHPQFVYPRRDPGQITVEDTAINKRVYIQGRVDPDSDEARFMVSYQINPPHLALLKAVLKILLQEEGTCVSLVVCHTTMVAPGPQWAERVNREPDWYWGYHPWQLPDEPFMDYRDERIRERRASRRSYPLRD